SAGAGMAGTAPGTFRWGGIYGHSWFVDPESELTVGALTNTTLEGMAGFFLSRFATRCAERFRADHNRPSDG
ncbi:MAG: serine hydrolase, partial [Verrucomicrobia bacterium]|nr:serine hydrolase [Verrucomicrobiota bacterium]